MIVSSLKCFSSKRSKVSLYHAQPNHGCKSVFLWSRKQNGPTTCGLMHGMEWQNDPKNKMSRYWPKILGVEGTCSSILWTCPMPQNLSTSKKFSELLQLPDHARLSVTENKQPLQFAPWASGSTWYLVCAIVAAIEPRHKKDGTAKHNKAKAATGAACDLRPL